MNLHVTIAVATITALFAPGAAQAQDDVGGGTELVARVPSMLELTLTQPAKGFAAFSTSKAYELSFAARVTTTSASTQLSVADGDAPSGSRRGHISVGAKRLPAPLEATIGKAAFQPLDAAIDPLLRKWTDAVSRAKTTIKLRQKVTGKATGSYRKLVLVTLSSETP